MSCSLNGDMSYIDFNAGSKTTTFNGRIDINTDKDTKMQFISADADNYSIIDVCNSEGKTLSRFGYYGDHWAIDNGKILTDKNFNFIRVNWENGNTFKSVLSGKVNTITIMSFSRPSDNPFSFPLGFAIAMQDGLVSNSKLFLLIGINWSTLETEIVKFNIA